MGRNKSLNNPVKVNAAILWEQNEFVVIQGPFPYGLLRSETRPSLERAINLTPSMPGGRLIVRGEASKGYAKTLKALVKVNENKWGQVSL